MYIFYSNLITNMTFKYFVLYISKPIAFEDNKNLRQIDAKI